VANGAQSAALLAAPGLYLEAYQPITSFPGIQLSGAVPTGLLSAIAGAVVGAVIGAAIGAKVGGPYGALIGGAIGAVVGGFTCGADPDFCEKIIGDDSCNACSGGASDTVTCGDDSCVDGCCSGVGGFMMMRSFLTGAGCPGGSATCQRDFDCGAGLFCVQQCCVDPQTIAGLCPNDGCSSDNDCVSGNHCRFGCCVGPCGVNGTACTEDPAPAMCGAPSAACGGGAACFEGCCVVQ
jgi:hypothetical protein